MKKLLDAPEVVAAIFMIIGTLLVSIILGFLEGRIGFGPLAILFAIILLGLLLYALYRRAGTKVTAGAAVAMVVIGFLVFFAYHSIRGAVTAAQTTAVAANTPAEPETAAATGVVIAPSPATTVAQVQPTATPDTSSPPAPTAPSAVRLPIGVWQIIPDLPQEITSLAVDPSNPQVVYAGATGFVYRSDDGGATWLPVSSGLPNEDVVALVHTPTGPGGLYAVLGVRHELFRSDDGGATWTGLGNIDISMGGFDQDLYIAPSDSNLLYYALASQALGFSPNGGQSWLPMGDGLPGYEEGEANLLVLSIHPADASILYAGTGGFVGQGHGVYKSVDGGQSWVPSNRGMLDRRITALTIDPADPRVVYAGGDSGEFFKSTDGGTTWTDLTEALDVQPYSAPRTIHTILIDPKDTNRLFLMGDNAALMFSGDGGQKWQLLGKPGDETQPYFSVVEMFLGPRLVVLADMEQKPPWRYAEGD